MRTLIFGSKGQLGRDLERLFAAEGEVEGYDLPEVDVADAGTVRTVLEAFVPDLVLNAAAYTNVDRAEEEPEAAFAANKTGARNVALAAAAIGAPMVHYSTDYVFGGTERRPYVPEDAVAPIGVYGRSKAAGESAVRAANPKHFIVRTAWLYGPGGDNFVEKILRAASSRPSLKVVEDEVGSPTHTLDLAWATRALCGTDAWGTYHAVNRGECSRFVFAKAILDEAGLDTPIAPCASSEFPTRAQRPLYSVLSVDKLEGVTEHAVRPWREALQDYIKRRNTHT